MKSLKKIIFAGLILIFLVSSLTISSFAKTEKEYIGQALNYLEGNKYTEAVGELEEALILIKNKANLGFANVLFTKEETPGFGMYNARENLTFTQNETFYMYGEAKNYTIKEIDENLFEIHLKEDIYLLDDENNILFGQTDFLDYHITSHSKNLDLFINSTITPTSPFPVGNYKFRLVLKDVFSQKTTEAIIEFSVVE